MDSIDKFNKLSKTEFISIFGNIFENTTKEKQIEILKAHPDLAKKAKIGSLTADSKKEQNSAGLDKCTEKEFNEFKNLNIEYKKKFGFPFIYAVKDKLKIEILNNFKERVAYDINVEFIEATRQVKKIANFRLSEIIK